MSGTTRLLRATALQSLALAISDAFITPYLWLNHTATARVIVFAALQFLSMAFVFFAAQRYRLAARTWLVLGTLILMGFLVGIIAGGHQIYQSVQILGVLAGLGQGAYWQGFYLQVANALPVVERDQFNARLGTAEALASLLGPLAGAAIIEGLAPHGYGVAFGISVVGLLPVLWWNAKVPLTSAISLQPASDLPRSPRSWQAILIAHGLRGLYEGVISVAPGLALFELVRSPESLGLLTSGISLAGLASYRWVENRSAPRRRRALAWGGTAILVVAALILAHWPNPDGLWAFGILAGLAVPLQKVPIEACTLDLIGLQPDHTHHDTARKELVLNSARALGLLAVAILLTSRTGPQGLTLALMMTPIAALLTSWALSRFGPVLPY